MSTQIITSRTASRCLADRAGFDRRCQLNSVFTHFYITYIIAICLSIKQLFEFFNFTSWTSCKLTVPKGRTQSRSSRARLAKDRCFISNRSVTVWISGQEKLTNEVDATNSGDGLR